MGSPRVSPDEAYEILKRKQREQRISRLCRMAGNIAGGMYANPGTVGTGSDVVREIARCSVEAAIEIERRVIAECEGEVSGGD